MRIAALLDKKAPRNPGGLVWDKSVGADKVAYLFQDLYMTGAHVSHPSGSFHDLEKYIGFVDGKVALEEKMIDYAEALQRFYFDMWTKVYLRKQSLCAERMLQKAVQWHIEDSELKPEEVWRQSEAWIDTEMQRSRHEGVRAIHSRIMYRDALKAAVAFKIGGHGEAERVAGKRLVVVESHPDDVLNFIEYYQNPLRLSELEAMLAEEFGISGADVAVAIAPEPEKLVPEDIRLYHNDATPAGTLFGRNPNFRASLEEKAKNFLTIRVHVPSSSREAVSEAAPAVADVMEAHSGFRL